MTAAINPPPEPQPAAPGTSAPPGPAVSASVSASAPVHAAASDRHRPDPYAAQARPHYAGKDPAHDFAHIRRILARVEELSTGSEPPPRRDLLYFLCCFHGLSRMVEEPAFRTRTGEFLLRLGWSEREVEDGFTALERHVTDPRGPEESLVHDANAWEALGVFGIAKAFTTGGARGQSYEETVRLARHSVDRPVFRTERGRALAPERRRWAHQYLDALQAELGTTPPPDGRADT